ncbi:porin family protein [Chryseobacterium echinoideorum]|uniref:porin family protein n=1 Tax=Chryseobacterium echinoideorum TaxID=1549648 RepID=UPI001185F414|nr:porin family protein [Chryseobacterium echinoideorum]
MKKILLGFAIVTGSLSFAQDKAESSVSATRFGLKAGLNLSSINIDGFKGKAGIYGGIFANIPLGTSVSVQPEVLYNNAGAKVEDMSDVKLNLDYISVPVMIQYNIMPELYLEAGPQFGVAINKEVKTDAGSADVKDLFRNFDFGVGLGAGYYFTNNIGITARYVAGLIDISHNNPNEFIRSQVFQVGLACKF